ncbi:hypothetical protein HPB50_017624 [Hyalomma asiaticum]|uniref:Uncharacterized protein n=1 Tax=Hyalomma asiaticum TaxID=266040 RepID=A0ACB7RP40_HYAAI|nr:hypothetical protein HPB50_017624 [Hyalomma asiaticum]
MLPRVCGTQLQWNKVVSRSKGEFGRAGVSDPWIMRTLEHCATATAWHPHSIHVKPAPNPSRDRAFAEPGLSLCQPHGRCPNSAVPLPRRVSRRSSLMPLVPCPGCRGTAGQRLRLWARSWARGSCMSGVGNVKCPTYKNRQTDMAEAVQGKKRLDQSESQARLETSRGLPKRTGDPPRSSDQSEASNRQR